jgi:hypothetical protein
LSNESNGEKGKGGKPKKINQALKKKLKQQPIPDTKRKK